MVKKAKKKKQSSMKLKQKKKTGKKLLSKRKKKVLAVPEGYHSVTPCLTINQAAQAIDFYKKAFAAKEIMRFEQPDGKIAYAEIKIGDAKIMLGDERPDEGAHGPKKWGGTPVSIHLYVKEVDKTVDKALSAGATLIKPVEDQFYGDRCGTLEDPYGHKWHISSHIEDVSPAKMKKRMAEFDKK